MVTVIKIEHEVMDIRRVELFVAMKSCAIAVSSIRCGCDWFTVLSSPINNSFRTSLVISCLPLMAQFRWRSSQMDQGQQTRPDLSSPVCKWQRA